MGAVLAGRGRERTCLAFAQVTGALVWSAGSGHEPGDHDACAPLRPRDDWKRRPSEDAGKRSDKTVRNTRRTWTTSRARWSGTEWMSSSRPYARRRQPVDVRSGRTDGTIRTAWQAGSSSSKTVEDVHEQVRGSSQ